MKLIYNNKEIGDNYNNYNRLTDKPLINSIELVGNITLNDINVYSKEEVKKLISSARSVKTGINLPSPLTPNTTYYIGPDMNGIYSVWLTDNADPINVFQIGTTSFGKYYSGEGINVTDPSNIVSVLVDSESVIVNSEGLLEARPIFEKMIPFIGATASKDGSKGLVPKPEAGDQDKYLFGDGTWKSIKEICDIVHPVGSLYIMAPTEWSGLSSDQQSKMTEIGWTSDVTDNFPATIWPGTTWVRLDPDKCLQTDTNGGTVIAQKAPNIKGSTSVLVYNSAGGGYGGGGGSTSGTTYGRINFDSSKGNSIYGGTLVRPPARRVWAWRRTA